MNNEILNSSEQIQRAIDIRKTFFSFIVSPKRIAFIAIALIVFTGYTVINFQKHVFAATGINPTVNFQGKVVTKDGTNVADGKYTFVFKIYDADPAGTNLWTETQSNVQVTAGIFRVSLGSVQSLSGIDFNSDNLYLGINFNSDGEMTPRVRFASVPYAFNAKKVAGLTVTDTTGTLTIPNSKTIQFGGAFTTGTNDISFTTSGGTTLALPTTGTLATLTGSENLSNKTFTTSITTSGVATDLTTGINEDLTLTPNGTGSVIVNPSAGGSAALIVDKRGIGDIFTASSSGTTRFIIKNDGTASTSGGLTFDGVGSLQSTKNQTLTIGGSSTGNIVLNSDGNNSVGIGTTTPTEKLTLAGGNFLQTASGNPTLKGTYSTSGDTYGVYVSGKYAYVADYTSGLEVVDISNPSAPSPVGTYDTSGQAQGVYVSGKYAYVADYTSGLEVVDISNPSAPSLVGTYDTSGEAHGVYVSGKYAYVADGSSGLEVVDISNPSAPTLVGMYNTSGSALGVYVSGKYAYVADQLSGLEVVDISNPSAPTLVGMYNTSGEAQGVYVSGKYAYVADGSSGLEVIDISIPFAPSPVGTYDTSGTAVGVYVGGKYAYVADGASGLEVIDISNPSAPSPVGTYDTSGNALGVYVSGKYAYVADYTSGLAVIDINGIETPSLYAGNIATNDLTVTENTDITNNLNVGNGLNIGIGGLFSNGAFSFVTSSGLGNFIQGAPTGRALLTLNQTGAQDIFTASSSGTTKFTIKNDGTASSSAGFTIDGVGSVQSTNNQTLTLGGGSTGNLVIGRTGQVVTLSGFDCSAQTNGGKLTTTSGGILTCAADTSGAGGAGSVNWTLDSTNGILTPINTTLDLLVGGNSTASAKFAVLGINNARGQQTASLSGNLVLDAAGSLQTTNNQTLTIGGGTTGNILINPMADTTVGHVGIGTISQYGTFSILEKNDNSGGIYFTTSLSDSTLKQGRIKTAHYLNSQPPVSGIIMQNQVSDNRLMLGGGSGSEDAITALEIYAAANNSTLTGTVVGKFTSAGLGLGNVNALNRLDVNGAVAIGNSSAGTNTAPANGLLVDGFVGLGVTNLSVVAPLDVYNDATNINGEKLALRRTGAGDVGISFQQNGISAFGIVNRSGSANGLAFVDNYYEGSNGVEIARFYAGAGVGIGTLGSLPTATLDVRGVFTNSGTFPIISLSGTTSFAALAVNNSGLGDLVAASSAGITKFLVKNDGTASSSAGFTINGVGSVQSTTNQTLTLGGGSTGNLVIGRTGQVVNLPGFDCSAQTNGGKLTTTSGGILTCSADTSGGSSWVLSATNGTLNPINNTLDLLVGGTSTQSAMFSVLGIAAGTNPSASVSALIGVNANKGIYMSGDGSLQSVRNNTLTIGGNTTGNVIIKPGNTPGLTFDVTGKVGIGTSSPRATLDVRSQNGTLPVASVSGVTSFAGLVVDNSGSGDIFTASSSGLTRFTIQQGGIVQIGSVTNGLTFDYLNAGPIYTGSARPTKTITLSPEYSGAILTPFYGAGTDSSITGSMTSDTDTTVGTSIRNYYQWLSTSGTQQFYTVAVRVTLPQDFSGWATSNAIVVNYITQSATSTNSTVEARIYRDGSASQVASSTGASISWATQSWGASSLTTWNTADQTAVIYLRLGSTSSNYARIGDIKLNYLSKF